VCGIQQITGVGVERKECRREQWKGKYQGKRGGEEEEERSTGREGLSPFRLR
jgi:hypothetical protein